MGEGEGREKRSKWPVHENESKFQSQTSQGRRKRKERAKTTGAQLFSFSSFSSFFFFSGLERVAKHDFYGIVLQSGSVKSSQVRQVRQEEEQGEQRAREKRESREGEGGRGCLYVCACFCARVSVCVRECVCTKLDFGREEDMLCVCVCVYMFKEALPPPPK